MHTKIRKFFITSFLVMSFLLVGCSADTGKSASTTEAKADNYENYQLRLRMFNDKHKTSYDFPDDADSKEWLLSLSSEQFEQYLTSVYDGTINDAEKALPKNDNVNLGVSEEAYIPNFPDKQ